MTNYEKYGAVLKERADLHKNFFAKLRPFREAGETIPEDVWDLFTGDLNEYGGEGYLENRLEDFVGKFREKIEELDKILGGK